MSMARWTPSKHPRDGKGRFRKVNVGVRVSTRSVSVTAGRRLPLIPGRVNLYVGGLARLENARRSRGPVARAQEVVTDALVNKLPEGKLRDLAGSIAKEGRFQAGSTLITASSGRRSTPTIRATRNSGKEKKGGIQTPGAIRSPNRKPRTRSRQSYTP
jgi:hypothetical protein